ncbi:hypothetical protein G7054_g6314 [Neopestalotiopsis clavispora]|nr:hypothetical protein G7054_g6314 [Neopestalotiopsis clavispora]
MASTKPLENIAIVGATGHVGKSLVSELLQTGKHNITALTRATSKGILPPGINRVEVDYDNAETLVSALRGQQFLIITLAVTAPPDTQGKIVKAAAEAGVRYVMPSYFGTDIRSPKFGDEPLGAWFLKQLAEIESLGLSYVCLVCGAWYEWSLALGESWFGFTIPNRKVTFFDDGETIITVSTWLQCGRAVAALLSLPESGASLSLSDWKNEPLYILSFRVSQRDMLASLNRVLNTVGADWDITYDSTAKRIKDGTEEFSRGMRTGIGKSSYAKLFMRSRAGEAAYSKNTANAVLHLPEESFDEATKTAVAMVESGWNPLAG